MGLSNFSDVKERYHRSILTDLVIANLFPEQDLRHPDRLLFDSSSFVSLPDAYDEFVSDLLTSYNIRFPSNGLLSEPDGFAALIEPYDDLGYFL